MWYFIFKVKELIIIFIPTNSLSLWEGGKWLSMAPVARRRQEVLSVFFTLPIAALLIGRLKVHEHRWPSIFLHTLSPPPPRTSIVATHGAEVPLVKPPKRDRSILLWWCFALHPSRCVTLHRWETPRSAGNSFSYMAIRDGCFIKLKVSPPSFIKGSSHTLNIKQMKYTDWNPVNGQGAVFDPFADTGRETDGKTEQGDRVCVHWL